MGYDPLSLLNYILQLVYLQPDFLVSSVLYSCVSMTTSLSLVGDPNPPVVSFEPDSLGP